MAENPVPIYTDYDFYVPAFELKIKGSPSDRTCKPTGRRAGWWACHGHGAWVDPAMRRRLFATKSMLAKEYPQQKRAKCRSPQKHTENIWS